MPEPTIHVPCASCLGRNRIATARLHDKPTCGRCKARLFADHPPGLDDGSFTSYVESSELPVVVDFWAAWCGPCRTMAPQFEAAARANEGAVLFAKVDTDAARQTAARFGIQSIPTMILFRGGREVARQSGAMSQAMIERWLRTQVAA